MAVLKRKGRSLTRKPVAAPPPPLPKVKGVKVDGWKRDDVLLVPVRDRPEHPAYLPMVESRVPVDSTWYLVRKTDYAVEGYATQMPGGLWIAWSWCGSCHSPGCTCNAGPMISRSVEYIWDKHTAEQAGEEWSHLHPNYKGSFRIKRAEGSQRLSSPKWDTAAGIKSSNRSTPVTAPSTAPEPPRKKRPLKRRNSNLPATEERSADHLIKNGSVDRAAADKEATKKVQSDQEFVETLIGVNKTRPKKPLKRRSK